MMMENSARPAMKTTSSSWSNKTGRQLTTLSLIKTQAVTSRLLRAMTISYMNARNRPIRISQVKFQLRKSTLTRKDTAITLYSALTPLSRFLHSNIRSWANRITINLHSAQEFLTKKAITLQTTQIRTSKRTFHLIKWSPALTLLEPVAQASWEIVVQTSINRFLRYRQILSIVTQEKLIPLTTRMTWTLWSWWVARKVVQVQALVRLTWHRWLRATTITTKPSSILAKAMEVADSKFQW